MTIAPIIFERFDEQTAAQRPIDAVGGLADLDIATGLVMPPILDGVTGKARSFSPATGHGFAAADKVAGSTLANRDVTVRAILAWDINAQNTHANPGTLITRGKGNAAAEYHPFGVEFRVVNLVQLAGEIRFLWQDTAGVLKTQIGGHFIASSSFLLFHATRRWVSSTKVVLRYYLADELLSEVISVDGSIGGGTTGITSIGSRFTGGAYARFFAGSVDELQVFNRELCHEEIRATWDRLTIHQPRARALVRDLHPPGFPISDNPGSRVQRETSLWGDAIGSAAAQGENVRSNIMPDRAYGEIQEQWEDITKQPPKPGDSIDERRARVTGRMAQKAGISIDGLNAALKPVIATAASNLTIIAFDQTFDDAFATLSTETWEVDPPAEWTISAGALRLQTAAGTYELDEADTAWRKCLTPLGGDGKGARLLVKITVTTLPANGEVGLVLCSELPSRDFVLLSLRNVAGVYGLYSAKAKNNVFGAPALINSFGGAAPANLWIILGQTDPIPFTKPDDTNPDVSFDGAWSTTSAIAGFTTFNLGTNPRRSYKGGLYMRTIGATGAGLDVKFDDARVRTPCGDRSFHVYVYRNPALTGSPDLAAANNIIRGLRQAHTHAAVITKMQTICDDTACPCDLGPVA